MKEFDFGSIEPLLINDEFLGRLQKLHKICHHFHLSVQSGCAQTLQRMNRHYTPEQLVQILHKLRKAYSDVILTTDIIVGFPGETEEEFAQTYEFLRDIQFYKMHVFKYSIRNGTKAASMEQQVPNAVKEERSKKLLKLSEENQEFYHRQTIGKKVEVLVEEKEGDFYRGHTANYMFVEIQAKEDLHLENKMVQVQPEKSTKNGLLVENVTEL